MKVEKFVEILGADFYTGVPDSQLKALCDYLMQTYGIDQKHHIIASFLRIVGTALRGTPIIIRRTLALAPYPWYNYKNSCCACSTNHIA